MKRTQFDILERLKTYGTVPISAEMIRDSLRGYKYPNNKIQSLVKDGYLIPLKKGYYCVSNKVTNLKYNRFVISNVMYGPSYISTYSALEYYGLIPESVKVTTAVTFKRSNKYQNRLGTFQYAHIPSNFYGFGYETVLNNNSYQIATREKALCDLIILKRNFKIRSKIGMRRYIEEDMRIDFSRVLNFNLDILDACIGRGIKQNELLLLKEVIDEYK
ncbi:MAG: type IV toxin-antitoxin system AbiEi family antitoxin domain-containing protein [Anaerovoracaceae bacterium]